MSVHNMVKNFSKGPDMVTAPKPYAPPKPLANNASKPVFKASFNRSENNNERKTSGSAPVVSSNDLQEKLAQIQKKRVPPPPTPDKIKQRTTETPEFLKKTLKSVDKKTIEQEEEKKEAEESSKNTVRNSILLFEQSKIEKPELKPKPKARTLSRPSPVENIIKEDERKERSKTVGSGGSSGIVEEAKGVDNTQVNHTQVDHIQVDHTQVDHTQVVPSRPPKGVKPVNVVFPSIPNGLEEWIKSVMQRKAQNVAPPIVNRSLKPTLQPAQISSNENDVEFYDDVGGTFPCEEIYDDVDVAQDEEPEELYDDAESVRPCDNLMLPTDAADNEELYDDAVGAGESEPIEEELYDDVENFVPSSQDQIEEISDTVQATQQDNENEVFDDEDFSAGQIYEPVETSTVYVTELNRGNSEENLLQELPSTKEDKKLKKEKIKDEKKKKKEEQERKKREEQEKKRKEKERKQFNLKIEGDLPVIERHITSREYRGKAKELSFPKGDLIDIISKDNCPKGKWLGKNMDGRLGYISLKNLGIEDDYDKTSTTPTVSVTTTDELLYEEVGKDTPPPVPETPRPTQSPSIPRRPWSIPPSGNEDEEFYDDIGNGAGEDIYEAI